MQLLQPLQEDSGLIVQYDSLNGSARQRLIVQESPRSCVILSDLEVKTTEITSLLRARLGDEEENLPFDQYIMKCDRKTIKNPFSATAGPQNSKRNEEQGKVFIAEGMTIRVMKPELLVEFPQEGKQEKMRFMQYQTVKVIKGFALKKFCKGCSFKNLIVSLDGVSLSDDQKIADIDFTQNSFTVGIRPQ